MDFIEWNDRYSVGNPRIDAQHRKLAELINEVVAHPKAEARSAELSDALNGVMEYAAAHFDTEENLLQQVAYPDFEAHRAGHRRFTETAAELCLSAMDGSANISEELAKFLVAWWYDHVLNEDMAYSQHVTTAVPS